MQIIANIGVNWWTQEGGLDRGLRLIAAAKNAGAHAICVPFLQADLMYRDPDLMATVQKFDMSFPMLEELLMAAAKLGLGFIVAPRHPDQLRALAQIKIDAYHIQNGDILYEPLLQAVADSGKPVYLSTGMATMEEVGVAIETLVAGKDIEDAELVLLHSTGALPTPLIDAELSRLLDLASTFFPLYVGYESFVSSHLTDYMALAYNPAAIMRRIDLEDGLGVEAGYSLVPDIFAEVATVAAAVVHAVNGAYNEDGLTESGHEARKKQMRCPNTEYLLPPNN